MHSLKSYTANKANAILGRTGRFWQKESYDHWVRDDDELERIVNCIRANPVKAGLCVRHEDWLWCSCQDRYLYDGDTSGWLVGH
jgi:putative DNA methylase